MHTRCLTSLVNDNHVDNNIKEILVYAYFGSIVNYRPRRGETQRLSLIRLTGKHVACCITSTSLRKHAYSNILRILPPKNENFQMKNSGSFHFSAQNIDCGYLLEPPHRGGSNKYPQYMPLSRNTKINVYPCKPQFYCIKMGFMGVKTI